MARSSPDLSGVAVVLTLRCCCVAATAAAAALCNGVSVASGGGDVQLLNGTSYGMTEIMTSKEDVLATPRLLQQPVV
jgi:hypothetical protein